MRFASYIRTSSTGHLWSALALTTLIVSGCSQMTTLSSSRSAPAAPERLRCEYRVNPLGIDTVAPRLSWQLNDPKRGAIQSAYHIVVRTEAAPDGNTEIVWDTGKVCSDQSTQVEYQGKPLVSGHAYTWTIRTWDGDNSVSPESSPAHWSMGILTPDDWQARWINVKRPMPTKQKPQWGSWIWDGQDQAEHHTTYLRRTFDIDNANDITKATIWTTADDRWKLFLNAFPVGEGGGWNNIYTFDVKHLIKTGHNALAVAASNDFGGCGLLSGMVIELNNGNTIHIGTDDQWVARREAIKGWNAIDFDASQWTQATIITPYGEKPWGDVNPRLRPTNAMCLRKIFNLKAVPHDAKVYLCGLGLYELHINGQKVGNDHLTPGWTHYYKRRQYQTYDVSELLQQGDNAIGVMLGNGWWSGGMGWDDDDLFRQGALRLIFQMNVTHHDNTTQTIISDKTWKAHPAPITHNAHYHGETYDARLECKGWDTASFDDDNWQPVMDLNDPIDILVAQPCETIQVTDELKVKQITEPMQGVYIFDFGQNAPGWVRLRVNNATEGTRIRLRFGEELDEDGYLYRENYRSAKATDWYICKGEDQEIWEPRFTYRGFRYCEVTNLPYKPDADTLTFRIAHSATPQAGQFKCSNELLNKIYSNATWGFRSNLHSVPTDCPQRDERLGWMGDAQGFAHASCYLRDMAPFYAKWMHDITDSQNNNGAVTDMSPARTSRGVGKPGWGDAIIIMPYTVYRFYGDTRIIEDNYDAMKAWIAYMEAESNNHLYEVKGYGDWLAMEESPSEWIGSAYYCYSTRLMAEMARAIGRTDDASRYDELADAIARAFHEKHFNPATNDYVTGTQTCNLLPLAFDITPGELRERVMQRIVDDIKKRGNHLSTGFLGTVYLMTELANSGQQGVAYSLAAQTTCPSWGYMVKHGATTIWERWDTDKHGPRMNSRNHFLFGVVARWMFENVAGINLADITTNNAQGFKTFVIRPQPGGDLQWATATYPSPYGVIESAWKKTDQGLTLDVVVPANTTARVEVPTLDTKQPRILEGTTCIYTNSQAVNSVKGITYSSTNKDSIGFNLTAGRYHFTLEHE